jgi:pyruvate dehydrogenase E2 component (dihydrolipoamide acetyltransferase)
VAPVGAVVAVISDGAGAATSASSSTAAAPAGPARVAATSPTTAISAPAAPAAPIKLDPFFEVRTPARNYGSAKLAGGTAVTPLARRLAGEAGIDLTRLTGSGPHGRIVARDIESALARRAPVAPPAGSGPTAAQIMALYRDTPFEEVPLDAMRRTIATRLVQAKQTIPHFYLTADLEIGRLLALREEANAAAPKDRDGNPALRLSVNDLVIKAWAAALQRAPAANAVWAEDRILRFQHSDIGVAVAIEGGLITPVVRQAERKTLSAISAEMRELAERARSKHLKPHEYQGGASAISNLGMFGVREFAAIINPPQATILAVGAARRQAIERGDGGIAFASIMTVTLSCDHRVVDGALGAQLLAAFRGFIEQPVTALV